jgi:hypothetical protein
MPEQERIVVKRKLKDEPENAIFKITIGNLSKTVDDGLSSETMKKNSY